MSHQQDCNTFISVMVALSLLTESPTTTLNLRDYTVTLDRNRYELLNYTWYTIDAKVFLVDLSYLVYDI